MSSSSSCSDLTSLSSDGGDDSDAHKSKRKSRSSKGKGIQKGKKAKDDDEYRLRNALKVPRATTYTAQALHDQIHSGDIDTQPEYQRDVVWPESKQIKLIDSVFRNFYIPPIIFAVTYTEDGLEKKVCIDGKQRLTSIQRFMDGLIPHKDPYTEEKLWYKDNPSSTITSLRKKRILPNKYRTLFANKQVVCVEYHDITDKDEREIFQRVQLGMALTPAEKLQVISSPRATFIRYLLEKFLQNTEGEQSGLTKGNLDWEQSRGSNYRCVAQSVYCMEAWRGTGKGQGKDMKSAGSIPILEKWLSKPEPFSDAFKTRVEGSFQVFSNLALEDDTRECFRKPAKVSPVEFILIALLVSEFRECMTLAELSKTISEMRVYVREKHEDIRMNDRCAKTMFEFLRNVDVSRYSGAGSSTKPSTATAGSVKSTKPSPKPSTSSASSPVKARAAPAARPASQGGATGKRKRGAGSTGEGDEDEDEEVDQLADDYEARQDGPQGKGKGKVAAREKKKKVAAATGGTSSAASSKASTPRLPNGAVPSSLSSASASGGSGGSTGSDPLRAIKEVKAKILAQKQAAAAAATEHAQAQGAGTQSVGSLLQTVVNSPAFPGNGQGQGRGQGVALGLNIQQAMAQNAQMTLGVMTPTQTPVVGGFVPAFVSAQTGPGGSGAGGANATMSANRNASGATNAPPPASAPPIASVPLAGGIPGLPPRPSSSASLRSTPMSMSISPAPPGSCTAAGAASGSVGVGATMTAAAVSASAGGGGGGNRTRLEHTPTLRPATFGPGAHDEAGGGGGFDPTTYPSSHSPSQGHGEHAVSGRYERDGDREGDWGRDWDWERGRGREQRKGYDRGGGGPYSARGRYRR